MTKLTDNQVREIRRLYKLKLSKQKDLCKVYNVSLSTINNIICGRTYKNIAEVEIAINQAKPYPCRVDPECQKAFKRSSARCKHERIHTKPFKCPECHTSYAEKDQAEYCQRHHNDDKLEEPDLMTFFNVDAEDLNCRKKLKKKINRILLKCHPDKGGDAETFMKAQESKKQLLDGDIDELLKDHKNYVKYVNQYKLYDSQSDLRAERDVLRAKLSVTRRTKGTGNDEYRSIRRDMYKISKVLVDKPYYVEGRFKGFW